MSGGWEDFRALLGTRTNFVFIGQAGCGKSEIALNFARILGEHGGKPVHLFDLDMTKPLFRTRDVAEGLAPLGVTVHFQEQFEDAPTQVGGVDASMKDERVFTILDVGGDDTGARAIGGYAGFLNRNNTAIFYVLNPYRPWSDEIDQIDQTLARILSVSHIELSRLHLVNNPNLGVNTTAEDVIAGDRRINAILAPYARTCMVCVRRELYEAVRDLLDRLVLPMDLFLTYEWHKTPDDPAQK